MSFKGKTHTIETRKRISESMLQRYQNETAEQREKRIQAKKDWYARAKELMDKEIEERLYQTHKQFVIGEYERMKMNGEI